ncbi:MAG: RpiB/LacA/LacB family sugar-phosphate isomerase [Oscillospiraceae bacterium]|nr:RpiB/LacA/LacB family sugar-phosphate isomerase [Oscillospiraceae bacterium]
MKIGVIQASSQKEKNSIIFESVTKTAKTLGHEVVNFGVFDDSLQQFSYIEIAICVSLLLSSRAVDFIVTGCSSGQGMMLACNSLPGVLCGYVPTPQDAFLFGRINNGNAVSLPLGLNWGWLGEINLQCTLNKLFDGPFGEGYPVDDAERKRHDTKLLKQMNQTVKKTWADIIDGVDKKLLKKALSNRIVYDYIMFNSDIEEIKNMMRSHR